MIARCRLQTSWYPSTPARRWLLTRRLAGLGCPYFLPKLLQLHKSLSEFPTRRQRGHNPFVFLRQQFQAFNFPAHTQFLKLPMIPVCGASCVPSRADPNSTQPMFGWFNLNHSAIHNHVLLFQLYQLDLRAEVAELGPAEIRGA
jgi:hypothetical protein